MARFQKDFPGFSSGGINRYLRFPENLQDFPGFSGGFRRKQNKTKKDLSGIFEDS